MLHRSTCVFIRLKFIRNQIRNNNKNKQFVYGLELRLKLRTILKKINNEDK